MLRISQSAQCGWGHTVDDRKFDQEDERIVKTLANFAAAGWQLWKARRTAEALANSTKQDLVDSIDRENKLQQQLQHSRSIGMPAVGIAHDFNNLLHVIQSYARLWSSISETKGTGARS
jgi:hypothetical protein